MKIRFQADADLPQNLLQAVRRRQPEIDFQTATAGQIHGRPGPDVLAAAADAGRILVTHDRSTMPVHFADFMITRHSPGVFIISQDLPLSLAAEELITIWEASEAEEWIDTILFLPL
jgi:hypothetical protein